MIYPDSYALNVNLPLSVSMHQFKNEFFQNIAIFHACRPYAL